MRSHTTNEFSNSWAPSISAMFAAPEAELLMTTLSWLIVLKCDFCWYFTCDSESAPALITRRGQGSINTPQWPRYRDSWTMSFTRHDNSILSVYLWWNFFQHLISILLWVSLADGEMITGAWDVYCPADISDNWYTIVIEMESQSAVIVSRNIPGIRFADLTGWLAAVIKDRQMLVLEFSVLLDSVWFLNWILVWRDGVR